MIAYAPRYDSGTKLPTEDVRVGDTVLQNAYGKGMGRLDDCGRTGTVIAVNRVKAVVDFGKQFGKQRVHPGVLRLVTRD